jgi:hypothetical protein
MSNNNLIPFSKFAEECFFEEGGASDPVYIAAPDKNNKESHLQSKEDIIKDANLKRLRKYRETMEAFAINFDLLKVNGEVYIPSSQKAAVKWIVNHYTNPVIRTYRSISDRLKKLHLHDYKRNEGVSNPRNFRMTSHKPPDPHPLREEIVRAFDELDLAEMRAVIDKITSILKDQLDGRTLQKELSKLYQISGLMFKEVLDHFYRDTLPSIIEEVKNTTYFSRNGTTLNDMDRLILLQYYMSLLTHANDQFREVTRIAAELRDEELLNISFHQANMPEDQVASQLWLHLTDFRAILDQAIRIYHEE